MCKCRCGYEADSSQDLDEHVEEMVKIGDEADHGQSN